MSFNVALLSQVITFAPIADRSLYTSDFHVIAKASSNLPVTVTSTTPDVCTVGGTSGRTVSLVAAGTCTLHADQAGSASFDQAPTAVATFTVTFP